MLTRKELTQYKRLNLLILLLSIAVLLPYIYLSFYSHPFADDFDFAKTASVKGIKESFSYFYFSLQGRYSSNLFFAISPLAWNSFLGYQLVPILMLALTILSFTFFFSSISNKQIKGLKLWICGLLSTLFFVFQTPSISQAYYWYISSVSYTLSTILALTHISLIVNYANEKILINKTVHIILAILLVISAIGCNEVVMVILLAFYVLLIYKSCLLKSCDTKLWITFFSIGIIASLASVLAPGTAARASLYPDSHQFFHSLFFSVLQCIRFFFSWISNIPIVLLSLSAIPLARKLNKRVSIFKNGFYYHPLFLSFLLFADLFFCTFPPYWSTGILGQYRTINVAYFFFIVLWFVNVCAWVNYFDKKNQLPAFKISLNAGFIILIITLGSFATTKNGHDAFTDILYGKAKAMDIEMKARYTILKQCKEAGTDKCYLPLIENRPPTLFFIDITPDHTHWLNRDYEIYFETGPVYMKK